jgi:hypothetical protein
MCCLSLNLFPLAAFLVEKLVRQKQISEPFEKEVNSKDLIAGGCYSSHINNNTFSFVSSPCDSQV